MEKSAQYLRNGALSALLVVLLTVLMSFNPYTAVASSLQFHGALQRSEGVGIISHRGAAAVAPENTMAAMRYAFSRGVDFVETDVQVTADGVPVLIHDETVDRTTTGIGRVNDLTYDQLKNLDAGSWFSADYAGEPIPTFEEFLEELDTSGVSALIELKGEWSEEDVAGVVEKLRERDMVNRVLLQSFEIENLIHAKLLGPEFARLLLTRELSDDIIDLAKLLQISAIGAREQLYRDNPDFAKTIRNIGIGAVVYTLNDEEEWEWAQDSGIDFVITDSARELEHWRARTAG